MSFNPFRFPQCLHTLVFVSVIAADGLALYWSSYDIVQFLHAIPEMSLVIGQARMRLFPYVTNVTLVCYLLVAWRFFVYVGAQALSPIVRALRYVLLASAFVSITGFLGFSRFPDIDDRSFQFVMEATFLVGGAVFFMLTDVLLSFIRKKRRIMVWVYDVFLAFLISSFIGVRVITMVLVTEEAISLASLLEYAAHFVTFLKFPILGWQLYGSPADAAAPAGRKRA
jgi:multisubunit Na+/H+ antiporter MnhG subunit